MNTFSFQLYFENILYFFLSWKVNFCFTSQMEPGLKGTVVSSHTAKIFPTYSSLLHVPASTQRVPWETSRNEKLTIYSQFFWRHRKKIHTASSSEDDTSLSGLQQLLLNLRTLNTAHYTYHHRYFDITDVFMLLINYSSLFILCSYDGICPLVVN